MPFKVTRITAQITQIKFTGPITLQDSRDLRAVLNELAGMLLVDIAGAPFGDCFKEFQRVRSLLPKTAVYGPEGTEAIGKTLPGKDYCCREIEHFTEKEDALIWLLANHNTRRYISGVA